MNHDLSAIIVASGNEKGGVGKTTTTATFLALLAMSGYTVLGIDMDPQAQLSQVWGYPRDSVSESIYEVLLRNNPKELIQQAPIRKVILPTYYDPDGTIFDPRKASQERIQAAQRGPDIIPITSDASNADYDLKGKHPYWGEQLQKALQPIRNQYQYILIDCPPSIQVLTINALSVAQWVLIPMPPEGLVIEGMLGILGVIEEAQERANPNLKTAGILLNKVNATWRSHRDRTTDLRAFDKAHIFDTQIKNSSIIAASIDSKSLVVLEQPNGDATHTYWFALHELLSIIGGPAQTDVAFIVATIQQEEERKQQRKQQRK